MERWLVNLALVLEMREETDGWNGAKAGNKLLRIHGSIIMPGTCTHGKAQEIG